MAAMIEANWSRLSFTLYLFAGRLSAERESLIITASFTGTLFSTGGKGSGEEQEDKRNKKTIRYPATLKLKRIRKIRCIHFLIVNRQELNGSRPQNKKSLSL